MYSFLEENSNSLYSYSDSSFGGTPSTNIGLCKQQVSLYAVGLFLYYYYSSIFLAEINTLIVALLLDIRYKSVMYSSFVLSCGLMTQSPASDE